MKNIQQKLTKISSQDILIGLGLLTYITSILSAFFEPSSLGFIDRTWWAGLIQNFSTEIGGAAITFWLFDLVFNRGREIKQQKEELTRRVRSESNLTARDAINELGDKGWLTGNNGILQNEYLPHTNLQNANLDNANLSGANLRNANLQDCDLFEADLREAKLEEADLHKANLINAKLQNANLQNTNLSSAIISNAKLQNTNLQNANLQNANLEGANLEGANLKGADLKGANLRGANLTEVYGLDLIKLQQNVKTLKGATMPDGKKYK